MAKGEQKGNREKKKPKAEKNQKKKHLPFGGRTPMTGAAMPGAAKK